jgi:hypothetical protein
MAASLSSLHMQVIQEHQFRSLLNSDIARQRKAIDTTIRQILSDLRSFSFLNASYPTITPVNVSDFLKSPIYQREARRALDTPSGLPCSTSVTVKVNAFLRAFPVHLRLICKCANLYFSSQPPNQKYNPFEKPLTLFACSTFPALFGYCWCREQGVAFVESLCQLISLQIDTCGGVSTPAFRTLSFVREIIRQFFHMQGIQKYLQRALSSSLLVMVNEERLFTRGVSLPNNVLVDYMCSFAEGLVRAVESVPSLVRYFLHRAFQIGGLELLQILVYDLLIKPALMNPKLFALFPETAVMPSDTRSLVDLTRIFWWAIKPEQLQGQRYPSYKSILDMERFKAAPLGTLFDKLSRYDAGIEGVSLGKFQDVTGVRYHLLLMSVIDVCFLTEIVTSTIDRIAGETRSAIDTLKGLVNFQIPIEANEVVDFWFQEFKAPIVPDNVIFAEDSPVKPQIYLPLLQQIGPVEASPSNPVVAHFINYLQGLKLDPAAPGALAEFLAYQKQKASQAHSTEWLTRTQSIDEQIQQLGISESELLGEVTAALTKGLLQSKTSLASSFAHQECYDRLVKLAKACALLNAQLQPVIYQAVLNSFLNSSRQYVEDIQRRRTQFLTRPDHWPGRFAMVASELKQFVEQMHIADSVKLQRQLHSELCRSLTFEEFKEQNSMSQNHDEALHQMCNQVLQRLVADCENELLAHLFAHPEKFQVPIEMMAKWMRLAMSPLEKLEQVSSCFALLAGLVKFEGGQDPDDETLKRLMMFTLLRAQVPDLVSLQKYIHVFLFIGTDHTDLLLRKERKRGQLFIDVVTAICGHCGIR